MENGKEYYDELPAAESHKVDVIDAGKFIEAMLRHFVGKGTLYVCSYDFGYWAESLAGFRSGDRVKLNTSLPDPSYLQDGFTITDDFVYVFSIDCLKSIDPRAMFNQFLIYDKGSPLLECCGNFESVYVNGEMPQGLIDTLVDTKVVAAWE